MATPSPSHSPTFRPTNKPTGGPSASPSINIHADVPVLWQCGLALGFACLSLLVLLAHVYTFAEDEPMYTYFGFMVTRKRKGESKEKGSGIGAWDLGVLILQALLLAAVLVLVLTPAGATPGVVANLADGTTAAILGIVAIALAGFGSLSELSLVTMLSWYHGEYLTCGGLFDEFFT